MGRQLHFGLLLAISLAVPCVANATAQVTIPGNGSDPLRVTSIQIANIGGHAFIATTWTGIPFQCQSTPIAAAGSYVLDLSNPSSAEMLQLLIVAQLSGRSVTLTVNDGMTSPATCFDWFGTKYPLITSVILRN